MTKIYKMSIDFDIVKNLPNFSCKWVQFDWIVILEFLTNGNKKYTLSK